MSNPRNAHIHPALRDVLNAFANTRPINYGPPPSEERRAELQAERIAEWRQEGREREADERRELGLE